MQLDFLTAFRQAQPQNSPTPATGLWLLHGDEDLLQQWLVQRMAVTWRAQGMAIQRTDIVNAKSWQAVLGEFDSLSLFDERRVIIAQGNHKPDGKRDGEILQALKHFAKHAQADPQNALIVLSPRFDKRAQNSAFYQLCNQYGQVVDCRLIQARDRHALLIAHAADFGLTLTTDAWQQLEDQTQNNLLSAYQTLWRLSYLFAAPAPYPAKPTLMTIDSTQLAQGLVRQAQFSTFDLSDAMLAGNSARVVRIMRQLKASDEPPSLVLWTLSKDMRALQAMQTGTSPASLGIWQSKQSLYQQAAHRHHGQNLDAWTTLLYRCDQAIKGLIAQPVWELLLQAALAVAGVTLFNPQSATS